MTPRRGPVEGRRDRLAKKVSCVRKDGGSIDYFVWAIEGISACKQAEKECARKRHVSLCSSSLHCQSCRSMIGSTSSSLTRVGLNNAAI
jgi:hypothetical protein